MKRVLISLIVVVVLVVAAVVAASIFVDADRFRPQVQTMLSEALGRDVSLGELHAEIWSGSLTAEDIRIGDDPAFGDKPFVSADSLALGVELWPLLTTQTLHVTSLELRSPTVRLVQNAAGQWNFASLAAGGEAAPDTSSGAPPLQVDRLRISDGTLVVKRAGGGAKTYGDVELSVDGLDMTSAFPFSMSASIAGGGRFALEGTAGPWNTRNAAHTPVDAHLEIHQLDLVGAGLVAPGAGVGGVLDFEADIKAEGGSIHSGGRISAHQLQLVAAGSPATVPLTVDYQASWQLDSGRGSLRDSHVEVGGARIAVAGNFQRGGDGMRLDLQVQGKELPLDDLTALLPAFGVVLPEASRLSGGTLGMDLAISGPLDALEIRGPVRLDDSRLVGFSLNKKLGTVLSLAGIPMPEDTVIEHAEANVEMTPQGVRAEPFRARITGLGQVHGQGGMAADGSLDAQFVVKLDESIVAGDAAGGQGGLKALLGDSELARAVGGVLGGAASQGIGIHVGGSAKNPSFKLDPKAMVGLLGAGIAATREDDKAAAKPGAEPANPEQTSGKDSAPDAKKIFGSLLRDALESGKDKDKDKDKDQGEVPQQEPH